MEACIPDKSENLTDYDGLMVESEKFEEYLFKIGFLSVGQGTVSMFNANLGEHFARKIRRRLLVQVFIVACSPPPAGAFIIVDRRGKY